ncbi:hypothetical protein ABVT39_000095 [Epinephelus coioides]
MARTIALIVSVRKIARTVAHSLRLADLEGPSGTDMRRVFSLFSCPPSHPISTRLTHPKQKQSQEIKEGTNVLCTDPPFRLRPVLPHSVDAVRRQRYGWAGRQQHHSRSISIRRQTMWEPMCSRMQMPHTGRDGLCDGEQELHADRA